LTLFIAKNKQLDDFQVNGKLIRHAVLTILQKNYQNSQKLKKESIEKFYNSINFLGALFNQMRLASGQTINIIGQSLLSLINIELEKELRTICHLDNDTFAKLVLSQVGNLRGKVIQEIFYNRSEKKIFKSLKSFWGIEEKLNLEEFKLRKN
jgi:hypothetical protein